MRKVRSDEDREVLKGTVKGGFLYHHGHGRMKTLNAVLPPEVARFVEGEDVHEEDVHFLGRPNYRLDLKISYLHEIQISLPSSLQESKMTYPNMPSDHFSHHSAPCARLYAHTVHIAHSLIMQQEKALKRQPSIARGKLSLPGVRYVFSGEGQDH